MSDLDKTVDLKTRIKAIKQVLHLNKLVALKRTGSGLHRFVCFPQAGTKCQKRLQISPSAMSEQ